MDVKISIIIPNYNKGEMVCHSLDSLLCQTCREWEAIVVDDCSRDGSWNLIQDYAAKDARIRAFRNETNRGGNYSRNRGVRMAQGAFLIFLDSDDWLAEDCVENRVKEFEKDENKDVDLLVFNMMSTRDGKSGNIWKYGDRKNPLVSFLRHEIPWQTMMPIWRKTAFERTDGFDEAFPRLQDVELHTRALLYGLKNKFAERTTPDCFYFIEESRMTANHENMAESFVNSVEMYVGKMIKLIAESHRSDAEKRDLLNALSETQLAAVANIGNSYQKGNISKATRNGLYVQILTDSVGGGGYVSLYAFLYKLGLNRFKGFNYLYHRIGRFVQRANLVFCSRK